MYAFRLDGQKPVDKKKAKGIPKNILKRDITFNIYEKTLYENYKEDIQFNNIRSYNRQIYSTYSSKTGPSNYENKRYYISNNYSLPYGHHAINDSTDQ